MLRYVASVVTSWLLHESSYSRQTVGPVHPAVRPTRRTAIRRAPAEATACRAAPTRPRGSHPSWRDALTTYVRMTDVNPREVKLDMPVELTFRKMHDAGGTPNYYWKCTPVR